MENSNIEEYNNMNTIIEVLIKLSDEITCELNRVKDTINPDEYEDWFKDNLETAEDLLYQVKDLISG